MMSELEEFRRAKDSFFAAHRESPLTREQKKVFQGLAYFPEAPDLSLELEIVRFPDPEEIHMLTTTGDEQVYRRYGKIHFTVDGLPAELTIYQSDAGFFLPFVDSLAGKETYPAGRYLEPEPLPGDRVLVDFNYAYNPYCAYNEPPLLAARAGRAPMEWSCPLTPFENRLKVPIRAGEKQPQGEWVDHEGLAGPGIG